jgi:hypothetical protein
MFKISKQLFRKISFIYFVILLSFSSGHTQTQSLQEIMKKGVGLIISLKTNKDYIRVFNTFAEDTLLSAPSSPLYDHFLFLENTIGLHKQAIIDFDKKYRKNSQDDDSSIFETHYPKNAADALKPILPTLQVVMTNEEHLISRHRILPLTLLNTLYESGFRYFAFEDLTGNDSLINQRGYADIKKTGYYSIDPIFGELIREAIAIGYILIPYESITPDERQESLAEKQQRRETGQAENLVMNILNKDPNAKILVHGGRNHIAKGINSIDLGDDKLVDIRFMAEMFKLKAGIDPFTIDQLTFQEQLTKEQPNELLSVQQGLENLPIILVSRNNDSLYTKQFTKMTGLIG